MQTTSDLGYRLSVPYNFIMRLLLLVTLAAMSGACGPDQKPFPEIDRSKLQITLSRSGCFGSCPAYEVRIDGDGNVVFNTGPTSAEMGLGEGKDYSTQTGVRVAGRYRTSLAAEQVDALIDQFKGADFFNLKDEYQSEITDNPTYIVSIDTGNGKKTVVDYAGESVGMPASVTRIEDAIDTAAGTERWIKGTPEVVTMLEAKGTDFTGTIGLELMDAAAERDDVTTMARLKALGAPVNIENGPSPFRSATYAGSKKAASWLLENGAAGSNEAYADAVFAAVTVGHHSAFRLLARDPRLKELGQRKATELLAIAAANADVRLVRQLLAIGADPRGLAEASSRSDPPLFEAANGGLVNDHDFGAEKRRTVVGLLLNAGASITHSRYGYPQSILWAVDDPVIAQMLISAGADPNFKDNEGEHILFSVSEDTVAMVLIAHGADLTAVRPGDGMTLSRWARKQGWPRVVDLLNRKGL
ncbi:MAG: DUF6438 domain-containing protein [Blastomonas fulva]|uniref:DUF6438 domain-containing protein n=1 Tax=Blastomonas fulva TaxID=1550728 RepID=UPI004034EB2E